MGIALFIGMIVYGIREFRSMMKEDEEFNSEHRK